MEKLERFGTFLKIFFHFVAFEFGFPSLTFKIHKNENKNGGWQLQKWRSYSPLDEWRWFKGGGNLKKYQKLSKKTSREGESIKILDIFKRPEGQLNPRSKPEKKTEIPTYFS